MIIDSHTHVDEATDWGWIDPPEALLPLLDEAGIDRAVVMTYRDAVQLDDPSTLYIVDAVARYPERLTGYIRLNPQVPAALEMVDQALHDFRLKGVKLHPVSYVGFPYGSATIKVMQHAARYQTPVLFHTGDEALALPEEVAEAARLCPEAAVILGHMGGYMHVAAALRLAAELPNLLLDTSAMPYPEMIRQAVEAIGPQRVLFASDGPGCLPALEVQKVRLAGLRPEDEVLVLGENIASLHAQVRHDL